MELTRFVVLVLLAIFGGLVACTPQKKDAQLHDGPFGYDPIHARESMRIRKEWRQLTIAERKDYIKAVKCLHDMPGIRQDLVPSSMTLFEDFAAVHKLQTPYIHWGSQFLPWHRYFVWTFENALRKKCAYKGAQPYWDYGLDAPPAVLKDSPVFDPYHGFGGDGYSLSDPYYERFPPGMQPGGGGGCQKDGPFADWTLHIARRNSTTPRDDRCLTRSLNAAASREWCTHAVETVIKQQGSFAQLYQNMQGASFNYGRYFGLHLCGHFVVAGPGSGADVFIGSVDPLFYLHHTNLDRIWWEWQSMDLAARVRDVGGVLRPPLDRFPGADYSQFPDGDITLDWEINVGWLAPAVKTENLMHIQCSILNYGYTNPRAKWMNGREVGEDIQTEGEMMVERRRVEELKKRWDQYKGDTWND